MLAAVMLGHENFGMGRNQFVLNVVFLTPCDDVVEPMLDEAHLLTHWDAIAAVLLSCIDDTCQSITDTLGGSSAILGPKQRTLAAELCEKLLLSLHGSKQQETQDRVVPSEYNNIYRALLSRLDDSNDCVRLAVLASLREFLPLLEVGTCATEPEVIEVTESSVDLDAVGQACPEYGHFLRSCLVQLRIGETSNSDAFKSLAMDLLREAASKDTYVFLEEVRNQNHQLRTNEFEDLIDHAELIESLKKSKR